MKKGLLVMINLVLVIMMAGVAYLLYQKWQDYSYTSSIEKLLTKMDKEYETEDVTKHRGLVGSRYVTAYYPKANGGEIGLIKEQMNTIIQTLPQGEAPKTSLTGLNFYYAELGDGPFKDSRKVVLKSKVFPLSKEVGKVQEEEYGSLLLNANQEIFRLNQLFSDPFLAKSHLLEQIKKDLGNQQTEGSLLEENLLALDETPLENWNYRYQSGRFEIDLPKGGTAQVAMESLYDVMDTNYLQGEELAAYQAYQEKKERKLVALTFDDGPSPATTPKALDILAKYNAKATFYMLGKNVAGNEDLIKRVKAAGHEIGNHSWDHPQLPTLPLEMAVQQITDTQAVLKEVLGEAPRTMRPPYGAISQDIQNASDVSFMMWDIDTLDWKSHNTEAIMNEVHKTQPGSVILMHDIHQTTIDALPSVLEYLKQNGYTFVTVSELFEGNLQPHHCYYSAYQQ
ncbi:polysaccharide deacetylase family protein [Streptococcus pneumoniae]